MSARSQSNVPTRAFWYQATDPALDEPDWMHTGIWWWDTSASPNIMKRRDVANTGWDIIGFMSIIPSGAGNTNKRTLTATGAQVADDDVVYLDTDSGAITFNLLTVVGRTRPLTIKNIGSSGNNATIDPNSTQTIDTINSTYVLTDGDRITIMPESSTNWETIQ